MGDIVVKESDAVGKLVVRSIKLSKIRSSEVYATLRLGDGSEWAQSTDIASCHDDTEWNFEAEDMSGTVSTSYLTRNVINFTVKDSNETSADKFVGKAKISTEELLGGGTKWRTFSGNLNRHDESDFAGEYSVKVRYVVPNAQRRSSDTQNEEDEEVQQGTTEE